MCQSQSGAATRGRIARVSVGATERRLFFLHAIAYLAATAEMVGWGKRGGGLLIGSGFIWRFHFLVFRPLSHAACCPSTFRCHLSVMESRLESLSASFPTLGRHVGDVANTADSSAPRWRKCVAVCNSSSVGRNECTMLVCRDETVGWLGMDPHSSFVRLPPHGEAHSTSAHCATRLTLCVGRRKCRCKPTCIDKLTPCHVWLHT